MPRACVTPARPASREHPWRNCFPDARDPLGTSRCQSAASRDRRARRVPCRHPLGIAEVDPKLRRRGYRQGGRRTGGASGTGRVRRFRAALRGCLPVKEIFEMMAAYNVWSNSRVYGAARELPEVDSRPDHAAFFGSIHGTLNHILLGDRIWMYVFTGQGGKPTELDAVLYDTLDSLHAARRAEDARIVDYVASLTESDLAGTLRYSTLRSPADIEQKLAPLLIHFFNHQTHHRAQAHTLLAMLTGYASLLVLLLFQRETGSTLP